MDLGALVKERRKALGLTQEELARRASLSLGVVNRLEAGRIRDPHYSTLQAMAGALGVDVGELVRDPAPLDETSQEAGRLEEKRRLLDYRKCREALDRFCDYWEQALDDDRLVDSRACEEFVAGANLTAKLLFELSHAEKVELQIQRGEDPQTIDKSEPWPPGLQEKSELWPAIARWLGIGLQVNKIATERFGEDASFASTAVADLREYAERRRAS